MRRHPRYTVIRLATLIAVAFDIATLSVSAVRFERKRDGPWVMSEFTPVHHSLGIMRIDVATYPAMPCFHPRGADGTRYAALSGFIPPPCEVSQPARVIGFW
jgi:hypothetical protein